MSFSLFIGLIVAVPLVVSFGEHARQHLTRMRQFGLATVGTCSLGLGVLFGTLFFSSIVSADGNEPPANPPRIDLKDSGESNTAIAIPVKLPDWVDSKPKHEGDRHAQPVSSEFFESKPEAERSLDQQIVAATNKYIDGWVGRSGASRHVSFSIEEIKRRWLVTKQPVLEHRKFSFGEMYRTHALLEFTPEFRKIVSHRWDDFVAHSRLWQMGLAGGGVLLVLLTFFGYFRMDNATRGFYTGRLQFLAAIAILALIGVGLYFANLIPWV